MSLLYQALFHGRISFEFWVVGCLRCIEKKEKRAANKSSLCDSFDG